MRYFYLHPFKPQYFFPKGFNKHKVFLSFYQPYSFVGRISWWLFRFLPGYRHWFKKTNIEAYIPEKAIRAQISETAEMAFNTGTPGPEQKITALGFENNEYFFIKYAQTPLAAANVTNEHNILQQLKMLVFVPHVLDFKTSNNTVLLKTSVLQGNRYGGQIITNDLIDILFTLVGLTINTTHSARTKLKTAFAHGDFCPWNMMEKEGRILLFDWEMAATYPLGYDLFTFIFQTNFLLFPEKEIQTILNENNNAVNQYFNHFGIINWSGYLKAFAEIKLSLEQKKGTNSLIANYQNLLSYAQKA